jgi:hypothetical protein
MTATRAAKLNGLNHFIYTVLEVPANDAVTPDGDPNHPVTRLIAATGISSVPALASFATEQTLLTTVITDTAGGDITGTIPVLLAQKTLALSAWLDDQSDPIDCHAELMALTIDSYEDFVLIDSIDKRKGINAYAPILSPAPVVTSTATHTVTGAEIFDRGLKRSVTDYKEFRERKHFNSWLRIFRATARVQDVDIVLDPSYIPSTAEEIALFDRKQRYVFQALTKTLIEPSASEILRRYSDMNLTDYGNAQMLFADLCTTISEGVVGKLTVKELERNITKLRLNKDWTKSVTAFVTHISHLLSDHLGMNPRPLSGAHLYTDEWYIDKLNDTFSEHTEMRGFIQSIQLTNATVARSLTGTAAPATLVYTEYLANITDKAAIIDDDNKNKNRSRRVVNTGRGRGRVRGDRVAKPAQAVRGRGSGRTPNATSRHTDFVTDSEYLKMTPDEKRKLYERRNGITAAPASSATAPPTSVSVPAADAQTVTTEITTAAPGTVVRNMLSNAGARNANSGSSITVNGTTYTANVSYRVTQGASSPAGALIDSGANGGIFGADVLILEENLNNLIDVTGIANNALNGLPCSQGAAVIDTMSDGPIVFIFSQYANQGSGKTIHSKSQLEHFGHLVHDNSRTTGGSQCLITPEGYVIPFHVREGLCYVDMSPPSASQMSTLPHVFATSDSPWNPQILDNEYHADEFYDAMQQNPEVLTRINQRNPLVNDAGFVNHQQNYYAGLSYDDDDSDHDEPAVNEPNTSSPALKSVLKAAPNYSKTALPAVSFDGIDLPDPDTPHEPPPSRLASAVRLLTALPQTLKRALPDLDALKPNFGWVSLERIQQTLEKTTQFYRASNHFPFRKHFRSRFPAANVSRVNEWYATDTFFSDTPALDDGWTGHGGCKMLQLFAGMTSSYLFGVPLRSEKDVPSSLEELIRKVGAPIGLFSDNAKSELSRAVKDILRMYCIKDAQSEPGYQNQNYAERRIQDVKRITNSVMDRVSCPSGYWLLCTLFVIGLLNVLANQNGEIPHSIVTGQVTDVSPYLSFHFWEEVLVSNDDNSDEEMARWCGPADNVGDILTYYVLLHRSKRLVVRSNVRPAKSALFPNRRAQERARRAADQRNGVSNGEETVPTGAVLDTEPETDPLQIPTHRPVVHTVQDQFFDTVQLPRFSVTDLIGMTFLHDVDDQKIRAKVVKQVNDRDAENHQRIKFLVSIGDDEIEELIAYNELSDIIEEQVNAEEKGETELFTFRKILDHQGPISSNDPRYKGSQYNVKVSWEEGSETWEPLNIIGKDDPATTALYAKEHDLLTTPGWKFLRRTARRAKFLQRMLNQSQRQQMHDAVRYKFGVRVPRNLKEAIVLDRENGDTQWQDSVALELAQLKEYSAFRSVGFHKHPPSGYNRIPAHIIFDVKQSGKRKARFVAGGHRTAPPKESVYSGVATLRSLRIVTMLAELNNLGLMAGDVGNAYLEAYTEEKVCFTAGPEFGELEGHTMIIVKALYGLRTSGARFHQKFADTMRSLGFTPSYADPDVWMRDAGDCYEYVCVYVDDLYAALKDPKAFYDALQSAPYNYKLKGVEEPKYHLGGDFFRDKDGTFCYSAQTYVKRLNLTYETLYGEKPQTVFSPMDKDDHPELDDSPLCGPDDTKKFQSIIGALQWTIQLCRFDIAHAVMSMSRFRHAPRVGHIDRIKRICGYLAKFPHAAIRFRTGIPNHEETYGSQPTQHDWSQTVYDSPSEDIPSNAPTPKGKPVRMTTFVDANLMHDLVTGRSCTGVLHFFNQTPVDWFTKRQGQVETATYGSEFMAARQAVEQIIDLRYTLRMLGVPIDGPTWLFGDNQSVVTSSTMPYSQLSKRWNALSYHRVREAFAAGIIRFEHIAGIENPADVLTKPLPHYKACVFYDPILFWKGETTVPDPVLPSTALPEGSVK